MRGARWLLIPLVGFLATATAPAADWGGVWRIVALDTEGNTRVHLLIGPDFEAEGATYFDDVWNARLLRVEEVSPDRLLLDYSRAGLPFQLDLSRKDPKSLVGKIEVRHPQYRAEIKVVGALVIRNPDWDPARVAKEGGDRHLVDLNALMLSKAADLSAEEFERFWAEEIVPPYYHLFEDFVYPEKSAERLAEAVRGIWELLRDPEFQDVARRLPILRGEVIDRIRSDFPELFFTTPFVFMPSLGNFAVSPFRVGDTLLMRVGVDRLRGLSDEALRACLAREQFRQAFYTEFRPWDETSLARIVRDGISTYLAVASGLAPSPESCLLDSPPPVGQDRLDEYRAELAESFESHTVAEFDDSAIHALGLAFAESFVTEYGPAAIRGRSRGEFAESLREFAIGAPAEDAGVP